MDECIIHYQRTTDSNIRHVSVDGNNNVWTAGNFGSAQNIFDLVDGNTGGILATTGNLPCGGYGGLVDGNGVLWSARQLLRFDPDSPPASGEVPCFFDDRGVDRLFSRFLPPAA